ncbi:hypothetical protein ACP275_01G115000 [Erythranthe tilingii]
MEGEVAISSRHFFKVMMPGFKDELILPQSVCKKLKQVNMMKLVAILKSGKGSWKIDQVCRSNNEDGVMCVKGEGWTQFVNDHNFSIADFLVFEYNINITTTAPQLHLNLLLFHTSSPSEKDFLLHSHHKHRHHHSTNTTTRESDKDSVESYGRQNSEFFLTMKPSHACKHAPKVTIPAEFVRWNNLSKISRITLRDPYGIAWPVKLVYETIGKFPLRMGNGWPDFYESNNLKNGDICRFQLNPRLLKSKSVVFDVKIFPAKPNNTNTSTGDKSGKDTKVDASCRSRSSEFVLTMKPSYADKYAPQVTIPAEFMRSNNLSKKSEITLRDPNGRAWPVKLMLRKVGQSFRLRMGKGWPEFYESNNLKNGDLCRFQLNRRSLKSKTAVFDVKISPS